MKRPSVRLCGVLCVCLLLGCIGGSSKPSRFYLLTPIEGVRSSAVPKDVSVRIFAVELPKHLRGPAIVTRVDGNQIEKAEFDRWAEPLSDNFALVLAKNLSTLIPSDGVVRFAWDGPKNVDYHVTVAVLRFDTEDGMSVLEARWTLSSQDVRDILVTKCSEFVHAASEEGYASIAQAMSAAVGDLSREIAAAIREQPRK